MSFGAVAVALGWHPLVAFAGFGAALGAILLSSRGGPLSSISPGGTRRGDSAAVTLGGRAWSRAASLIAHERSGRILLAAAVLAALADRHLFVASIGIAPDDAFALVAAAAILMLPRSARGRALARGLALAAYVLVVATLISAKPYHSDAVVGAHAGAELLLDGRHPYAAYDLVEQLARFGLPETYATPLEDGTRLRTLQYPALVFLVPAPFVAAGLADVRAIYLVEVLLVIVLVAGAVREERRDHAIGCGIGSLVVLDQAVLAGVDPLWALGVIAAWLARDRRWSAIPLGLAIAARQPAWLVAPFLVVWTWQRYGTREAVARAVIALAVALGIQLPFLVSAPQITISSVTDPALRPLEPWGVGPAGLGSAGVIPLFPRGAYAVAAGAAYVLALWAFAAGRLRAPGAALTVPLLPLWIAWRALQNYFMFLPLFLLVDDARDERR
jgi:uncharacterized membrane protein